ncbi:MAG: diversity-generating retroelement protein Avd [Patescibacteria group bacterium]
MEEIYNMPLFKKAYEFYKKLYEFRKIAPKQDKYAIFEKSENITLEILEGILIANQSPKPERITALKLVSVKLNMLRIFVRLMKDTRALDLKKYITLEEMINEIGKMLGGWLRSLNQI